MSKMHYFLLTFKTTFNISTEYHCSSSECHTISKLIFKSLFFVDHNGLLVGCRIESNCPLVGPGTIGGMPSVGVFLRDPSRDLRDNKE